MGPSRGWQFTSCKTVSQLYSEISQCLSSVFQYRLAKFPQLASIHVGWQSASCKTVSQPPNLLPRSLNNAHDVGGGDYYNTTIIITWNKKSLCKTSNVLDSITKTARGGKTVPGLQGWKWGSPPLNLISNNLSTLCRKLANWTRSQYVLNKMVGKYF